MHEKVKKHEKSSCNFYDKHLFSQTLLIRCVGRVNYSYSLLQFRVRITMVNTPGGIAREL